MLHRAGSRGLFTGEVEEKLADWQQHKKQEKLRQNRTKLVDHIPHLVDKIIWQRAEGRAWALKLAPIEPMCCRCVGVTSSCHMEAHSQPLQSTSERTHRHKKPQKGHNKNLSITHELKSKAMKLSKSSFTVFAVLYYVILFKNKQ